MVRNSLGVSTPAELVKLARSGAPLSYGSSGVGSTMHIGGELFNIAAGAKATHVPYRGAAPALIDLIAGRVDMVNADVPVLQPYVKDGRVKAIVITTPSARPICPTYPARRRPACRRYR